MNLEIVKSKRKTLTVQVYRDQRVVIRAPHRCPDTEIRQFLINHDNWIHKKLAEFAEYPGLPLSKYKHRGQLWLKGKCHSIDVIAGIGDRIIHLPEKITVMQKNVADDDKTRQLLTQWKNGYAVSWFNERLLYWHSQFHERLPDFEFKMRKMKRQWGNCSQTGVITINRELIRYPKDCIDYVLAHELTHLKHMNHGKGFYQLLGSVMPNWKERKEELFRFSGYNDESL